MNKTRLEAFSDGVIAIIITIMVLEIHVPETADWNSFMGLLPILFGYVLSFTFVGIYWNNHHHLLHTVTKITPLIMWTNHNQLFWLSLVPFATAWMEKTHFSQFSVVVYAVLLSLCGVAYDFLRRAIIRSFGDNHNLKNALEQQNIKALASTISYILSIIVAFWNTGISMCIFVLVAILWIVPSKAIEDVFANKNK